MQRAIKCEDSLYYFGSKEKVAHILNNLIYLNVLIYTKVHNVIEFVLFRDYQEM